MVSVLNIGRILYTTINQYLITMSNLIFYTISNASMSLYPENSRSGYLNHLPKQICTSSSGSKALWLSLESITFENSIIQYKRREDPDIISFHQDNKTAVLFFMPEKYFENVASFINDFRTECINLGLKDVCIKNGYITLTSTGSVIYMSAKLYRFLGFTDGSSSKLGTMFFDNRMKKYYNRTYYVIRYNELIADQLFDLNIYKPRLIKIISQNVKKYESGGGFKNILSIIPLDHSKSTITYIPSIKQYFKANSDYMSNISVNLVDENDRAVGFTTGPQQ